MTFGTIAFCFLLATGASAQTMTGVDEGAKIAYALLSVEGKVIGGATSAAAPRLTAQCTKDAGGKLKFELLADAGDAGEMRYATPGFGSNNMEDIRFYLQYMRSLPTLRLTLPFVGLELEHKAPVLVEFETAKWQAMVKAEPLCGASGL